MGVHDGISRSIQVGIKSYRPNTPSLRGTTSLTYGDITRQKPEKRLATGKSSSSGRDSNGRISVRRRGGGHKRRLRSIDFRRDKHGVPGVVREIEYDPNRSANIALIQYAGGEKRYILAPRLLRVGQSIQSGPTAPI